MAQQTILYDTHREFGGRLVEFAGWDLPLHFGSQLEEHRAVRRDAGMFDVSHMAIFDLDGPEAQAFLRMLLANDIARLDGDGRALYTCVLNESGGVIDDAIAYRRTDGRFRLVSNAATRDRVTAWITGHAVGRAVRATPRPDLAIIAVQGPEARGKSRACLPPEFRDAADALPSFGFVESGEWFVARTGYTGEDGYEIILPVDAAPGLWRGLASAGVAPCGLGARDTLRLEAGLALSGQDMDETVTPLESGLTWTVAFDPAERDFIGRASLEAQRRAGGLRRFVGLLLDEPGVLRHGQRVVVPEEGEGIVTSGIYSPTLGGSIAFARLPAGGYGDCWVDIRGRLKAARVVGRRFLAK
ncbi:glycine cleavage system aminomethyltransferase GcvT [Methylomagnum sp.]